MPFETFARGNYLVNDDSCSSTTSGIMNISKPLFKGSVGLEVTGSVSLILRCLSLSATENDMLDEGKGEVPTAISI